MKIALIAGESSGDKLGAALIDGLDAILEQPADFIGVAGPRMITRGMDSLFAMQELSVMGIVEILKQYPRLKRRLDETADYIIAQNPDVLITIDAPEFSLRLAKIIHSKSDIPTVHYVAPTVWAWRPKRADKMAHFIDHVLALFPFEPPLMQRAGMSCDFVGHPVVTDPIATNEEVAAFRDDFGIGDAPLVLILPGSRNNEISKLMAPFGETLALARQTMPDLQCVLPAAPHVVGAVQEAVQNWPIRPIVLDHRELGETTYEVAKRAAFRAADVALAASGTVSLELAANDTPMVIAYDMGWLSRQIIGRMLITDTVTLVNLVTDTRVIPEFIGKNCRADLIAPALLESLIAPQGQLRALRDTMDKLGRGAPSPGTQAAGSVIRFLNGTQRAGKAS
ncbi:MAG: lipid-A-disaccharide synthase [Rhodobacteraceae bacterium]|jgi:lipid-A-disaccharide synthase|nr:lipid-A-disaccharide synthase [Paracoccaceae bacterium]NCW64435.1 lipid-A-disaccharide synthase [Paracoccaceae bacterium]HAY90928.1 lipid-A-disaccharide synthase [Paracoccaceae bacterium]